MKNIKKRNDIILIAVVLTVAMLLGGLYLTAPKGERVVVSVNGAETSNFPLSKDRVEQVISENGGKNTLVIKDGKAYVTFADCPDKICVSHRKISREGETIVCLPHKLVISIEAD